MDFPFGHHNRQHHHHNRDRDDEDDFPRPPPPFSGAVGGYRDEPPPPPFQGGAYRDEPPRYGGGGGYRDEPPPPPFAGGGYRDEPPPPPFAGGGYRDEPPPPPFAGGGYRDEPPPPPFRGGGGGYIDDIPPPNYGGGGYGRNEPPPPFAGVTQHHHSPPPPEPHSFGPGAAAYPTVQHVSHETHRPQHSGGGGHGHGHGISSFIHNLGHGSSDAGSGVMSNSKPTVRVYSKAELGYSLTVRDGQVVLAPANPNDDTQHWIKDEKYSTKVKDKEGHPCFSLVNKATGEAIKHSIGASQPVKLVPYNPNVYDESVLWTESKDLGDGYRCIRMVSDILLNMDAFNGDKQHGGVRNGTVIVLWEWKTGDNQRWKIARY